MPCAEILRNEKEALGTYIFHREVPSFVICSADDCLSAVQEALERNQLVGLPELTAEGILERINRIKNEGVTVEGFREQWLRTKSFVDDVFLKVYREYQAILQKNLCMDFNDLIMYVLELFEKCPELLEKYQEQYRYIMVDEYQDTNHLQYELVQNLADGYKNLCVVGDDDQSIYGFRGADINNILNFKRDYQAEIVILAQNYRSSGYIVDAANAVIANNKNRLEKKMFTKLQSRGILHIARTEDAAAEAALVVNSIEVSHKQGIPYNEIAVLYRINNISTEIQKELTRRGIPYRLAHGIGIVDHKETKDVLAYLRLIDNPDDDIAFKRAINVPTKKIPDRAFDTLATFARKQKISLFEALKRSNEVWPSVETPCENKCFVRLIEYLQKVAQEMTIPELINEVLDKSGYEDFIQKNYLKYTMQYIFDMIEFAKTFDSEGKDRTLNEYLEEISFMTDADKNDAIDAVNLLSGHRCKGLEFDLVYIIGLEDGILPHANAIESTSRFDAMEEERRLFYVMLTRAKKYLFITSAKERESKFSIVSRPVSRFVRELKN